jgi:iron complex outermembrane receptor protein
MELHVPTFKTTHIADWFVWRGAARRAASKIIITIKGESEMKKIAEFSMNTSRAGLLICTALVSTIGLTGAARAQAGSASADNGGLQEIIVTAQKREQSMQDVPIAVTAVTQDTLQANRITTVNDLSAIAPGLTVKPSAGGISTPSFTMRGQVSFGVVAGSDKQVSVYVDGVYISSPRGSIFALPDIQRLEVLRGPQGTLFGRNATAGAISITTRDPTGEAHLKVESTYGNYDAYRFRITAETPQIGPFSAYVSYVREYKRGDIENAGAGTIWDRSLSPSPFGKQASPRYLGTIDSNSYFAAVKFAPSDSFKMVYKFDRNDDHGTPDGTGFIGVNRDAPLTGALMGALIDSQTGGPCLARTGSPVCAAPNGLRPDIVSNSWVTARDQRVQGHSLTTSWIASDHITVKDILAYRKAVVFAPSAIDGISALTFTPQALVPYATLIGISTLSAQGVDLSNPANGALIGSTIAKFAGIFAPQIGSRFLPIASEASSISEQWSDELQANYTSEKLQVTVGALWFHSNDEAGGPLGMQNTFSLALIPASGLLPLGNEGRYFNKATSLAAYAQVEYKITPKLEVVGGARITKDNKTSSFRWDVNGAPQPLIVPPAYKKTKPNFLAGLNWEPRQGILIYGKYSTSFVSGGSTAGITYAPETASSFELGFKGDFLDHHLRANLALFHVDYNHFQSPGSTTTPSSTASILPTLTSLYGAVTAAELVSSLSTFVVDQGKIRANGFELELTAAPVRGLTMGTGVGYTDVSFPYITPAVLAANDGELAVTARPKWTASLFASYETLPVFGDATIQFRVDGQYRSRIRYNLQPKTDPYTESLSVSTVQGFMLVNGRIGLRHLKIGPADAELSFWGKNITNRREAIFFLPTPLADSANYVAARTYGIDLSLDF